MKKFAWFFLAILFLALFLRVYDLGQESIWIDEGFALDNANRPFAEIIEWVKDFEPIPPLYYVTLHFWINGFGTSEFNTRLLSVIFNLLTLPIFYLFAKKLFNNKTALIASLFFATSMLQVQYSQEVRSYAMFSFFAWLSSLIFLYIVLDKKKWFIPYTITTFVAAYVMQMVFLIMFLQNVFFFAFFKKNKELVKPWLISQIVVLLAFIPWWPVSFKQIALVNHLFQQAFDVRLGLPYFISNYPLLWLAGLFVISFLIKVVVYFKNKEFFFSFIKKLFHPKVFVSALIIILALYVFLLNHLTHSIFIIRYFFFLLPIAYLLFAFGIMHTRSKRMVYALALIVLLVNCFALFSYYSDTTKPEWKQAIAFIDGNAEKGEIALLDTGYSKMLFDYYSAKIPTTGFIKRYATLQDNQDFLITTLPELKAKKGIWLVLARNFLTKDLYKETLDKDDNFTLISEKQFLGVKIYHYALNTSTPGV